jgi:hypothetical protein
MIDAELLTDAFLHALTKLRVDSEGCAVSDWEDIERVVLLCPNVRLMLAGATDEHSIALRWLVTCTEGLLTTYTTISPNNPIIVELWTEARVSLLQCRIGQLE